MHLKDVRCHTFQHECVNIQVNANITPLIFKRLRLFFSSNIDNNLYNHADDMVQ